MLRGHRLEGVATFRTSGNVVFDAGREARGKLTGRIEKALAARQPFPARLVDRSKGKLQVALLPQKPPGAPASAHSQRPRTRTASTSPIESSRLPSGGTRDASLDLAAVEKPIGPWTMRTKGTLAALHSKYFA